MKLVLLTYVNRSGSTFLANLFSKSPDILVCPEAEILIDLFLTNPGEKFEFNESFTKKLKRYMSEDHKLRHWSLDEDIISGLKNCRTNIDAFASIITSYKELHKPAAHAVVFKAEKLLDYIDSLDKIENFNYQLYFISILRDCRAIYASQKNTYFPGTMIKMSNNPVSTSLIWNHFYRQSEILNIKHNFYFVQYESLIADTEHIFNDLITWLSLNQFRFISVKGDLFDRLPDDHKDIHVNINEDPIPERLTAWKKQLTNDEVNIIQEVSKNYLSIAGYKLEKIDFVKWRVYLKIIYFYISSLIRKAYRKIFFHLTLGVQSKI